MSQNQQYIATMNQSLRRVFRQTLRLSRNRPSFAFFVFRTILRQRKAARMRRRQEEKAGIHVPPYLIMSITNHCNLRCKGCYNQSQHRAPRAELTVADWRRVLGEAGELGVSVVMIAGGEPWMRPEIIALTREFPGIVFPVFTNGLLLEARDFAMLRRERQVFPVISLEGYAEDTDARRGSGVHQKALEQMERLKDNGIFYGVSVTVTATNFTKVTSPEFVQSVVDRGCKILFFVEYIPVAENTAAMTPSDEQRQQLRSLTRNYHSRFAALFVAFPGDEEMYDGCLAAGRGFIHISADGSLEPCPFAPYSDSSVRDRPLREALQSKLLREIRANHANLTETDSGCALWSNRHWVEGLVGKTEQQ